MAATEPVPAPGQDHGRRPGGRPPSDDALPADPAAPRPRPSTRTLLVAVVVLAVLLLASGIVGFVVLHQPRLSRVPVPSVSSIA